MNKIMQNLKGLDARQTKWVVEMNAKLDHIAELWATGDRRLAKNSLTEKIRKDIDTACERVGLNIPQAWDADGWDGEEDADIITYRRRLCAIVMLKAGIEIQKFWFVSLEQAMAEGKV